MHDFKVGDCIVALDADSGEIRLRKLSKIVYNHSTIDWDEYPEADTGDPGYAGHSWDKSKIFLVYSPITDPTKMYYPDDEIEIIIKLHYKNEKFKEKY